MVVKYRKIRVGVRFRDQVHGGIPKVAEVVDAWAETKGLTQAQIDEAKFSAVKDGESVEEIAESVTIGFLRDEQGLYVKDITWKAHLKDMLSTLKIFEKARGTKNETVFGVQIRPENVRFIKGVNFVTIPGGYQDMIGHVSGPQGRRSILKKAEYIYQPACGFAVYVMQPVGKEGEGKTKLTYDHITSAFLAGQEYGYGADRSMGYGRYDLITSDDLGIVEIGVGSSLTE